jgi:hypothetical protein
MPVIDGCHFARNHAQRAGGALDVRSVTGELLVRGCLMQGNTVCSAGGAVAMTSVAKVVLQNSLIWRNSALVEGRQGKQSLGHGGGISHVCPESLGSMSTWLRLASLEVLVDHCGASVLLSSSAHL